MPRASDPRIMVRFSPEGHAAVKAAAESAGVSVGGLVRECAERFGPQVAREVREGRLVLRQANASSEPPKPGPARLAARLEPVAGADRASAFRAALARKSSG